MSRPSLDLPLPEPTLHVVPWHDHVIDLLGHDPRSPYVERFWLGVLGPTCTVLLRHVAAGFDHHPDGFDLDLEDTARAIGLGMRRQPNGPFHRGLARIVNLRMGQLLGDGSLAVRHRLPPLTRSQLDKLPPALRDEHRRWTEQDRREPTAEERRTRARRLALSLLELGESTEATEQQLHRWKVHPAMAHEAMRWAEQRRQAPIPPPPGTPRRPAATPVPAPAMRRPPLRPAAVFTPTGDAA
jgi:hypothetical protein